MAGRRGSNFRRGWRRASDPAGNKPEHEKNFDQTDGYPLSAAFHSISIVHIAPMLIGPIPLVGGVFVCRHLSEESAGAMPEVG